MRTSSTQFEMMVTYMEQHGDLSKPCSNARGRMNNLKNWEELVELLNSDGAGDSKTLDKWKKVWSDFKNNTKKKAARLHRAVVGTGGGPANLAKLSDLEQRLLRLVGLQVATGLAVEEAGLTQASLNVQPPQSQPIQMVVDVEFCPQDEPGNVSSPSQRRAVSSPPLTFVEEDVHIFQPWNEPGPSTAAHVAPAPTPTQARSWNEPGPSTAAHVAPAPTPTQARSWNEPGPSTAAHVAPAPTPTQARSWNEPGPSTAAHVAPAPTPTQARSWNEPGPSTAAHVAPAPTPTQARSWNEPGPSTAAHVAPAPTPTQARSPLNSFVEQVEDQLTPTRPCTTSPVRVVRPEPALSGQTTPRRVRTRTRAASQRRVGPPPAHTEQAAQHFLQADEYWRKFKLQQHRDYMDLRREQIRIRELEVQATMGWQALGSRMLDSLEKIVNKYCKD